MYEIIITPKGGLYCRRTVEAEDAHSRLNKIYRSFAKSPEEGLFRLAVEKEPDLFSESFHYWREFAVCYLRELCHIPDIPEVEEQIVNIPDGPWLQQFLHSVPPIKGSEYLTERLLIDIWHRLDGYIRTRMEQSGGRAAFLKKNAPHWHQVGRVCFHLAENKKDPYYPFAFMATYAPELSGFSKVRYLPLNKALQEYSGTKNRRDLIRLLSPIQRASEKSALIKNMVVSEDIYHPLAWTPQEAYAFLKEVSVYEESGILVRLPDWWKKKTRPQVEVTIGHKTAKQFSADALLSFDVDVVLGDEKLSDEEWRQLMDADDGLVFLKGQWVEVNRDRLRETLQHWEKIEKANQRGEIDFIEGMRLLAGASGDLSVEDGAGRIKKWSYIKAGGRLAEILSRLRTPEAIDKADPGKSLKTQLRPYQKIGVNWIWFLSRMGLGACLADDMGLGKTIQVIALLLILKKQKARPSLLILPASLLGNWKSEIERFAPSLTTLFIHRSQVDEKQLNIYANDPGSALTGVDIVLTTYAMLERQPWLLEEDWSLAILDEAQAIKNSGARQTRNVKKIKAAARIALTGTPVENSLSDLWSLFDFLCPGLLGSADKFKKFIKRLESRQENRYAPLRDLVSPYILRRLKTDKKVISDLPDKIELNAFCGLSPRQAALYKKSVDELSLNIGNEDGIKRRGIILAFITRFKQICNHPSQFLNDGFYKPEDSGKFKRLSELCQEIASRQEKVLIFSQFREITQPVCSFLSKIFGRPGIILHGGTPVKQRKKIVDSFQDEDGPPFFVLSLKAGGTGLNLTAASHVIHFDRWWNPAVENQATDRTFRIGQTKNVVVHKFICQGTIEDKINVLLEEKKDMADQILKKGPEKILTEMDDQSLINLVSLDINKASV